MNKFLINISSLVLILSLAACGGGGAGDKPASSLGGSNPANGAQVSQTATIELASDGILEVTSGGEALSGSPVIKGQVSADLGTNNSMNVVVYNKEIALKGVSVARGLDWTFIPETPLNDGSHSLKAAVVRFDGVTSPLSAPFELRVSSSGPSITPKNTKMPALAFNQNSWPSDTSGTLPGTVLFAQSQIIPATTRIANDSQPHVTGLRDTLVLFKADPSVELASGKSILLKAYAADGGMLGAVVMAHPNDMPKTPLFISDIDVSTLNFDTNLSNPREVSSQAELDKLNDPKAVFLKELLAANSSVRISLRDGAWVSEIFLPEGDYTGKKIVVVRNSGYGSMVKYPLGSILKGVESLSAGSSTAFMPIRKTGWASKADSIHSRYVYGQNFWSAVLKKEWIQPGLRLDFVQGKKSGSLKFAANGQPGVMMGAPTELLLHVIDVGMLTQPRGEFKFAKDDSAHQEYFQTLPVSRFIVSRYEPVYFDKVVMPTGEVFTPSNPDPSLGGWHTGGMREAIGKELISLGIDHANYGISSSRSTGGTYPFWTAQLAAHNSRGKYANGDITHGGSGGGGIVTLDSSIGNEFSHELGHNYGLGHFEGGAKGTIHRPANDVNSTWGWDSKLNVLIPNFNKNYLAPKISFSSLIFKSNCLPIEIDTNQSGCVAPFQIDENLAYGFGSDSMGGGEPPWLSINRFTMYTPYTATKIQKFLESKAVFDKSSSTGFRKWNATTLQMEEAVMSVSDYFVLSANPNPANTSTPILYTQYLQALFDKRADIIDLNMFDGGWRAAVTVPPASDNAGKVFRIKHYATYGTTVTIDGVAMPFTYQTPQKIFKSDGSKWTQLDQFVEPQWVRKPELFGVPVVTIVGFYDPQKTLPSSYIYPALHGAYGYVYPSEDLNPSSKGCLLQVSTNDGSVRRYKLKTYRFKDTEMNRFQVNIPQTEGAKRAEVWCDGASLALRDLDPAKDPASLTYTVNGMPLPK